MLSKEIVNNMQHIVDNCMGEDIAACVTKCPMHCNAKEYIKLIRDGKGSEAIKTIRQTLITPGVLGRICAHPCESDCRRGKEDDPLSIAKLKRYVADNFDKTELWDLSKKEASGKSVVIIGGGPAGLQAAYQLLKEGHAVTIFDKNHALGGVLQTGIPQYRLPRDVVDHEVSLLYKLGVEVHLNTEIGKDISFDEISNKYDAVLISVGRQIGRIDQSVVEDTMIGVYSALSFLKSVAQTKSCDHIGKIVTVIGGGDVSIDCARSARRLQGVEKVNLVCLEKDYQTMPASAIEIHEALEEGVEIHLGWGIQEIITNKNQITKIKLKKYTPTTDKENKIVHTFDTNTNLMIDSDSIIYAVGQMVDTSIAPTLDKNINGTFAANPATLQTKIPKIFVAGDCASSFIVISAMSEGKKAALSIHRYLSGQDIKKDRIHEVENSYTTKLFLPQEYLPTSWDLPEKKARKYPNIEDPKTRIAHFNEIEKTYSYEQAMKESNRCLQCECKLCMKECLMLSKYTSCPKSLFTEYIEKGYEAMEPKIAFSCNDCNQCTLRCPHSFNIQDNFMAMRRDYVAKRNGFSDFAGHITLDDGQELECSEKYSFDLITKNKPKYVFIPGCTVPASLPEHVEMITNHLSEALGEEVSTILRCCGRPTEMIGQVDVFVERYNRVQQEIENIDAETIITICPSCNKTYERYSGRNIITYWELMQQQIGLPKGQKGVGLNSDAIFNIFDPCSSRTKTKHHDAVRWIMDELGYSVEEMTYIRENTRCCGVGGMLGCVDPELLQEYNVRRVSDATQDQIVTYCGSCRGSLERGGKDGVHILQLLFSPKPYMKSDACTRSDNYGFHNRMDIKQRLIKIDRDLKTQR